MKLLVAVLIAVLSLAASGCLEDKPRSFFAPAGVTMGSPTKEAEEVYRVPLEFTTQIVHSGQWIYDVEPTVDSGKIYVTAVFTTPPGLKKSIYPGYIELRGVKSGTYPLLYRDPNGSVHSIGALTLP